jgi:hypothetical protein
LKINYSVLVCIISFDRFIILPILLVTKIYSNSRGNEERPREPWWST